MESALAYLAAVLVALWGVAHVVPTRQVVAGFGPIGIDSRRVITQEWIAEGLTMWFIAAVIVLATTLDGGSTLTAWIYRAAALMLAAVGGLTAVTGARTGVIWFKICPVLLGTTAVFLLVASFL